jgi:hypothetical protein
MPLGIIGSNLLRTAVGPGSLWERNQVLDMAADRLWSNRQYHPEAKVSDLLKCLKRRILLGIDPTIKLHRNQLLGCNLLAL